MFFECNLERKVPYYYYPQFIPEMQKVVDKIYARTDLLNRACDIVLSTHTMTATAFQQECAQLFAKFNAENAIDIFDSMKDIKLAQVVMNNYTGKKYPDRIEWGNVEVLYDTAFVSTKDWETLRHFGIGGSDAATLIGDNPYNNLAGLWYDKKGVPKQNTASDKQAIFDRGHFLEDTVIDIFCTEHNMTRIPETRMFRSKKYPASTANIDAILRDEKGNIVVFEAKSATDVYNVQKKFFQGVPRNYYDQVQQYLAVLDDPRVVGAFLGMLPCTDHKINERYIGSEVDPQRYKSIAIARDEEFGTQLLEAEHQFWTTHVERESVLPEFPEEMYFNPELEKEIRNKYKLTDTSKPADTTVTFQEYEIKALLDRFDDAKDQITAQNKLLESLKDAKSDLQNQIMQMMNGSAHGIVENSNGENTDYITCKRIEKRTVNAEYLQAKYPDIYAECCDISAYSTLSHSIKPPKTK